ncbi:MAG TPA: hypothetical protein VJX70_12250 [Candidatus Acidoferrum sp.]|nr:hypothetical protein [Candidatus Acidoferrum sp.]
MSNSFPKGRLLVYLLPSLHICACLATVAMNSDWKYVGLVDYPVSIAAVGLAWHYNWPPFLLFGILGTLWWYLLSRAALFVFDRIMSVRGTSRS